MFPLFLGVIFSLNAQRGFGFRFASDFNSFSYAKDLPTIEGWFSNARLGVFYQAVFSKGGFKTGLNFLTKPLGSGFPLIMTDFRDGNNTAVTAIEYDLRAGPRFWFFTPAIGFVAGYRFSAKGWLDVPATQKINKLYFSFPVGVSFDWPTSYGSVGFGVFFNAGLTNIDSDPTPGDKQIYDGSRMRTLSVEITNVFASGKQEKRNKPPKPEPIK